MLDRVDLINLIMLVENEINWLEENNEGEDNYYEEEILYNKDLKEKLEELKRRNEKRCLK